MGERDDEGYETTQDQWGRKLGELCSEPIASSSSMTHTTTSSTYNNIFKSSVFLRKLFRYRRKRKMGNDCDFSWITKKWRIMKHLNNKSEYACLVL